MKEWSRPFKSQLALVLGLALTLFLGILPHIPGVVPLATTLASSLAITVIIICFIYFARTVRESQGELRLSERRIMLVAGAFVLGLLVARALIYFNDLKLQK